MSTVREIRPSVSYCLQLFTGLTLIGTHALAGRIIPDSIGDKDAVLYGTFAVLLGKPVQIFIDRALKPDVPTICSKIISLAGSFFGGIASAWGITKAIVKTKNEFSYPDALTLSATATGFCLVFLSPCIYCLVNAVREPKQENMVSFIPRDRKYSEDVLLSS